MTLSTKNEMQKIGAKYYYDLLSIWLSVDPMAHKYPHLSSYVYCANNPVKYIDPNGMEIGNYYDESGKFLRTDGINDGKVYIDTKNNGTIELPSYEVRQEMSKVIEMDNKNSYREYGGVLADNTATNQMGVFWAKPGQEILPDGQNSINIDFWNFEDNVDKTQLGSTVYGTFHSHPSGENSTMDKNSTAWFVPTPSDADKNLSKKYSSFFKGNSYVFGLNKNKNIEGSGKVHIYNGTGVLTTFPIDKFTSVK